MDIILVGAGGFLGAIARYLVYLLVRSHFNSLFPIATISVNTIGCFLAGILLAFVQRSVPLHSHIVLFLSVGFLGAFTTFSAFGLETVELIRTERMDLVAFNILANLALGFFALWLANVLFRKLLA